VTRCKELVHALEKAGLEEFVLDNVVGNGFLPGVTSPDQIADPKHPCKGAVPRVHAHFFTADGQFGSLDFTGQQVDAGIYTIIGPDPVVIDNGDFRATFHYRFTDDGDTIRLYPHRAGLRVCYRPVGCGGGLPRQEVDARELGEPRKHERPREGDSRRVWPPEAGLTWGPHPYQRSTAKHRAIQRLPRPCDSVSGAGMGSIMMALLRPDGYRSSTRSAQEYPGTLQVLAGTGLGEHRRWRT
jgi:hypothetical protein